MSKITTSSRGKAVRLPIIFSLMSLLLLPYSSIVMGVSRMPSSRQLMGGKNRDAGQGNTLGSWFGNSKWFKKLSESKFFKNTRKTFKEMSYDELKEARTRHKPDTDTYVKYTERMATLCDEAAERAELILELADGLRVLGKLDTAAARYAEFSQFYPGHPKTEYALYRAVDCSFKRTRSFDRDQSKTLDTVELANSFLERQAFTEHRADVETIRMDCYAKLIASELNVCNFYLKADKIHAVERRLETVRTTMLQFAPSMETEVTAMTARLPGGGVLSTDVSTSPLIRVATDSSREDAKKRAVGATESVKVAQAEKRN